MIRFAIDIDSTLYDFSEHARKTAWKMAEESGATLRREQLLQGACAKWPEWRSPDSLFGHDLWMEVLDRTHSPEEILKQKPYEGAAETIGQWVENGHEVFFITSRDPDVTAEATAQWLDDIGIQDPTLLCTGRAGSKIPTLIMREANVLIDDRPQTLVDFAYEDNIDFLAAIGIEQPYNRGLSDIPRLDIVASWYEIPSVLERRISAYERCC